MSSSPGPAGHHWHTPDRTPPDRLRHRLEADRQKLLDSGIYLGESNNPFLEDVTWQRVGRGYQLVTKDSIVEATTGSTNTSSSNQTSDDDEESESLLEQAVFSVVVQISYNDCWLTPCGYWKGPNKVTKKFEDLKLTFQGERPSHEVFAHDFTTSVGNLRQLINQQIEMVAGSDPEAVQRGFLSTPQVDNAAALLKFRHVLFEKLDGNESDTASESESQGGNCDGLTQLNSTYMIM